MREVAVRIPTEPGGVELDGDLIVPEGAAGLVVFAHGSGSSRFSPRNRFVAGVLRRRLGTLLLDLLSAEEERIDAYGGQLRFDIDFLAERLLSATDWACTDERTRALRLGYFGSSTGAAAALVAAAARPDVIAAVVSRGGRPDLAEPLLDKVYAPTLLLVGGDDEPVLSLNRAALARLRGEKDLVVIPNATHLFEEPGALERVAELARDWFERFLGAPEARAPAP